MLNPGTLLQNRYQILQRIGGGGMGEVYLALDTRLSNQVVVKENRGGDARQFQIEANLLSRLTHSNLPRVTDYFLDPNGLQYLVMDYVAGQDLDTLVQQHGAQKESSALKWMRQIFDAVKYLHANQVIHRDIKPQNIILTPQGRAMLVDFGIAKVYLPGRSTIPGARAITPGYTAPEQYRSGTDQRSDIYSLGATWYTLVTGRIPPDALALAAGSAALTSPRALIPSLSVQTEQRILRAMAVLPERRFQSVDEMSQSQAALSSSKLSAPHSIPATVAPVLGMQFLTFAVWGLLLAAICLVGLMISGVMFGMVNLPVSITPSQVVTQVALPIPVQTTTSTVIPSTATQLPVPVATNPPPTWTPTLQSVVPTANPPGRIVFTNDYGAQAEIYIVPATGGTARRLTNNSCQDSEATLSTTGQVAWNSDCGGSMDIWIVNADGSDKRNLTNRSGVATQPDWSPDGASIIFKRGESGREGDLQVLDVRTLQTRSLGVTGYSPSWSPDGKSIVYAHSEGGRWGIYLYDMATRRSTVAPCPTVNCRFPKWSPNGQVLAFHDLVDTVSYTPANIYSYDVLTKQVRKLTSSAGNGRPTFSPDGFWIAYNYNAAPANSAIYRMALDGTLSTQVADLPGDDYGPDWNR